MHKRKDTKKIQDIADKIAKEYQPEKIILFGSYARGNPGPDSDVDLFIIKETNDIRNTARMISRLIFPRPFPIDIIVYHPKNVLQREARGDFFIKDILTRGKILYEAN